MNSSTITCQPEIRQRWNLLAGILAVGTAAALLTGCDTTRQVSQTEKDFSGFLGGADEYALLKPKQGNEANFVWIDKNAPWDTYTNVCVMPIELWASDDPQSPFKDMPKEEQQRLVSFFQTAIAQAVYTNFVMVREPGPNTLVAHVAITEARKSKPVLNLITSIYPAALVVSYAKQSITGIGTGVGAVRVEAYFTDGLTGQRVAMGVDARAGTKAWRSKFNGTWGDAKLAFDFWAQRFVTRVKMFQQGNFSTNIP